MVTGIFIIKIYIKNTFRYIYKRNLLLGKNDPGKWETRWTRNWAKQPKVCQSNSNSWTEFLTSIHLCVPKSVGHMHTNRQTHTILVLKEPYFILQYPITIHRETEVVVANVKTGKQIQSLNDTIILKQNINWDIWIPT